MADFFAYVSGDVAVGGWSRFALDAMWQTTLIGLVALAALALLRKRPAARSCVTLLSLSLCVAVPVLSASARAWGLGMLYRSVPAARRQVMDQRWRPVSEPTKVAVEPVELRERGDQNHESLTGWTVSTADLDAADGVAKVHVPGLGVTRTGWIGLAWLFFWAVGSAWLAIRLFSAHGP